MAMNATTTAATQGSHFATATSADSSKVKKGLLKVGHGIVRGFVFVVQLPSNVLKEKDGFEKIVNVGASALEATVFALGTLGGIKSPGIDAAKTLVKGVKKFIDLIDIFDNIHDLADYLKKASEPRSLTVALWTIPKVASTVLFTISSGMGVAEFVMTTFNVGTKALSFTIKGLERVPVFGLVAQVLGGAGMIASTSLKGYDLYKGAKDLHRAKKKLLKWEGEYGNLRGAYEDPVRDSKSSKEAKTEGKSKSRNETEAKAEAEGEEKSEAKTEAKPEVKPEDFEKGVDHLVNFYQGKIAGYNLLKEKQARGEDLDKKEKLDLDKGASRIRKWEKRRDLLTQRDEKNVRVNFIEIIRHKKLNIKAKKYNHIRTIVKSSTGVVLNAVKIGLMAASIAFMATGLVGLPFAAILMGASLAINVGGLVDYTVWKFIGEKKVAAPAA